jgi:hypothetical protein
MFLSYQVLREEFQALQSKVNQLQIDYNRMKPTCLELEQQLETAKRMNQRIEDELIFYKNKQAETHDFENDQFNEKYLSIIKTFDLLFTFRVSKKVEPPRPSFEPSIFIDDDIVIISSAKTPADSHHDGLFNSTYVH